MDHPHESVLARVRRRVHQALAAGRPARAQAQSARRRRDRAISDAVQVAYRVADVREPAWRGAVLVSDGEDPIELVALEIHGLLDAAVEVTIGDETKCLAAWLDPDWEGA